MTPPTTPFAVRLAAMLALLAVFIIATAQPALGAEIDTICSDRKDAHCVSCVLDPSTRLISLTFAVLLRRIPAAKDLAQLNASISCDLPNDFIATDTNPNGARAALPDESKGRANAQCKGDPVEQQYEYTFSNAKGSTLQAAHTNTPVKDAKTTIRFSDDSGKDPEPNVTLTSHGVGVDIIWSCRA